MYNGLYRWHKIDNDLSANPFNKIATILNSINLPPDEARKNFLRDYYDALCFTNDENEIINIFESVISINSPKYQALIPSYPFTRSKTTIRSPDITREAKSVSRGKSDVSRNQTETQTETPTNYGQERTHSVAPFDSTTFKSEYKDEIVNKGTRDVTTSYTGDPDHTETKAKALRKDTETGTETTTETVIGSGALTLTETMDDFAKAASIWQLIERDLAEKLFLQVWM